MTSVGAPGSSSCLPPWRGRREPGRLLFVRVRQAQTPEAGSLPSYTGPPLPGPKYSGIKPRPKHMLVEETDLVPGGELGLVNRRHLFCVLPHPLEVMYHATTDPIISRPHPATTIRAIDVLITHTDLSHDPQPLRPLQRFPLDPPSLGPVVGIMHQTQIHIPAQPDLLHTLFDPFQRFLYGRGRFVDLCDNEELGPVDGLREGPDGLADERLVIVLLGGVECAVADGKSVVDRGGGMDAAGTEDITRGLRVEWDVQRCVATKKMLRTTRAEK